jgi:hypothetical protein
MIPFCNDPRFLQKAVAERRIASARESAEEGPRMRRGSGGTGVPNEEVHVMPHLWAGRILLRGKPLSLRRGTRLPQPGGGQAGVSPVERHGQDAHATARGCPSPLPLCASAPLRYLSVSLLPSRRFAPPESEPLRCTETVVDNRGGNRDIRLIQACIANGMPSCVAWASCPWVLLIHGPRPRRGATGRIRGHRRTPSLFLCQAKAQ